jgi:hypothetical protein
MSEAMPTAPVAYFVPGAKRYMTISCFGFPSRFGFGKDFIMDSATEAAVEVTVSAGQYTVAPRDPEDLLMSLGEFKDPGADYVVYGLFSARTKTLHVFVLRVDTYREDLKVVGVITSIDGLAMLDKEFPGVVARLWSVHPFYTVLVACFGAVASLLSHIYEKPKEDAPQEVSC